MPRETFERKSNYWKGTFMCLPLYSRNTSQFFWKSLKIRGRKIRRLSEAVNRGTVKTKISCVVFHDGVNNNVTILAYQNVSQFRFALQCWKSTSVVRFVFFYFSSTLFPYNRLCYDLSCKHVIFK